MKAILRVALCLGLVAVVANAEPAIPPEAAYQFILAQSLAQEGREREAVAAFERAVRLVPAEPFVRLEYAELLYRIQRYAEAREQAEEASRLAPRELSVLRLLGQLHLTFSDADPEALERAQEVFEEIRRTAPDDREGLVPLGQIYLSQGRPDDAAAVFGDLLEAFPADRMLLSFLIDSLQRAGRSGELEVVLREFLEADPDFLKARLRLAEILGERGEHLAAARTLDGAPPEDRLDAEVVRRLALELYRAGQSAEALAAIDGLMAREPEDLGARYLKAILLAEEQREQEALALLEGLVAERPDAFDFHILLAQILERQDRRDEAVARMETLARRLESGGRPGQAAEARLQVAQMHVRAGHPERALAAAEQLTAGEGHTAQEARLLVADALHDMGDGERALNTLAPIPREAAVAPRARAKQAEILFALGREAEAEETLRGLANAADLESLLLVAETYQQRGLHDRAVPVLLQARQQEPESIQVLFWLGAAYERSGQRPAAESEFRRLLDLDPEFAPALNYLGYMWADHGENLDEALELVTRAVQLEPDNGAYVDSLGWAYYRLGRYEEARDHLERAAELIPDDAVIAEHLGDLYLATGQRQQALDFYRRAVRLEGENVDQVRRKLEELGDRP